MTFRFPLFQVLIEHSKIKVYDKVSDASIVYYHFLCVYYISLQHLPLLCVYNINLH